MTSTTETPERSAPGRAALVTGLLLPFLAIAMLLSAGEFLERAVRYRNSLREPGRAWGDTWTRLQEGTPRRGADRGLVDAGLPVYDLRIRRRQLGRMFDTIEGVQARGHIDEDIDVHYERATFLLDGEWLPIRVKLRGWASNHYNKRHPSLRLKFPGNRLFRGMAQINLVDPYDKAVTADVTTLATAANHGLITWENRFVVLRVNDEVWGIYLEIEQPRREMIDRAGRVEGPIYSPNGRRYGNLDTGQEPALVALDRVTACASPEADDDACGWNFIRLHFDVDRMAWAAAIMGLSGHGAAWLKDNLRFYFDPARGRFEPIPWDYGYLNVEPEKRSPTGMTNMPPGTYDQDGEAVTELGVTLLRVPEFRLQRDRRLWLLMENDVEEMKSYAGKRFARLRPALAHGLRHRDETEARRLHEEFLHTLDENTAYLRGLLSEQNLRVEVFPSADAVVLRLVNGSRAAVEVSAVRFAVPSGGEGARVPLAAPAMVPGRWQGSPGEKVIRVARSPGAELRGLSATNAVTGEELRGNAIEEGRGPVPIPDRPADPPPPVLPAGASLREGRVVLGPGRVELRRTLDLPEGLNLAIRPGTDLRLGPDASLIVHGDVESRGTSDRPITVRGLEPTVRWGTFAVLGHRLEKSAVELEHVTFDGGSGGASGLVRFSGVLSVHDGTVRMRDVRVANGQAEDGVNLKYSAIDLERTEISRQPDDGLDLDFCEGRLAGVRVSDVGGDGIDFSGSRVHADGNTILRFGDKGMSVGERSRVWVTDVRIDGGKTGVAVKDASVADLSGLRVSRTEVGVGAYVKKPSFGGPEARVSGVTLEDVASPFARDRLSVLLVDGRPLEQRDP